LYSTGKWKYAGLHWLKGLVDLDKALKYSIQICISLLAGPAIQ
jgi:hypothetical protein